MNKALAQYIFGNETLYESGIGRVVNTEPIQKTEIPASVPTAQPLVTKAVPPIVSEPQPLAEATGLTILVTELSDEDKAFLSKILMAVGINIESVDLIQLKTLPKFNRQSWLEEKTARQFISFGVGLAKLGWHVLLPPYQPKNIEGTQFLLIDDLKSIAANVLLKKKLWEILQKMFPKK